MILLRKRPVLDEWAREGAPLRGRLVLRGRCLEVRPSGDQRSYMLFWPADYGARATDDQFEIVDGAGQVVTRVGDEVRLPGGEITPDWDFPRYRRLHDEELPCDCNGPYWIVAD